MLSSLRLHEALLLLAVRDEKGGFGNAPYLAQALAGAVLMELVLEGRIKIEKVKRSNVVRVVDQRLTGEPLMDTWLEQMRSARKEAGVTYWISRIVGTRKLVQRIAERLWHAGIFRREERSFLWFNYNTFVLGYPSTKRELVDRLRRLINEDGDTDAADAALVALASKSGVLSAYFDRKELKMRRKRIEQLVMAQPIASAVGEAVAAVHAAVATSGMIVLFALTMSSTAA